MVMFHSYPEVYKPPNSVVSFFVFDYGYSHTAYQKHTKKTRSRVSRLKTYRYLHHFLLVIDLRFCAASASFMITFLWPHILWEWWLVDPSKVLKTDPTELVEGTI
jgi:hypothetical protein